MLFSKAKPISVICLALIAVVLARPALPVQGQQLKTDLKKAVETQQARILNETHRLHVQAHMDAPEPSTKGDAKERVNKVRRSEPDPGEGNKGGGNQRIHTSHQKLAIPGIHTEDEAHIHSKPSNEKRRSQVNSVRDGRVLKKREGDVDGVHDGRVLKKRASVVDLRGVFAALGGQHSASTEEQKSA